jgi:hypothetical protein
MAGVLLRGQVGLKDQTHTHRIPSVLFTGHKQGPASVIGVTPCKHISGSLER